MSWLFAKPRVKEVDPAEARRRHDEKTAVVIDVREPHELREGYIAGARHIPLGRLQAYVNELLDELEIIFVCRSGNRSAGAAAALTKAGHANVYNLAGGMIAWKHQGLPVVE